jgi:hypothetical protein
MTTPANISIIIPTVDGRKHSLERTRIAYKEETPGAEIITVPNYASCGEAWLVGAEKATQPYIHFTADDIIPKPDWWLEATLMLDLGIIPVCRVIKGYGNIGEEHTMNVPCGDLGDPPNVMVPFLTRGMLDSGRCLLPIHYGSDSWVSYWAVKNGHLVARCESYQVTHYMAPQGRVPHRQIKDMQFFITAMEEEGYLPPFWEVAKRKYGMVRPQVEFVPDA